MESEKAMGRRSAHESVKSPAKTRILGGFSLASERRCSHARTLHKYSYGDHRTGRLRRADRRQGDRSLDPTPAESAYPERLPARHSPSAARNRAEASENQRARPGAIRRSASQLGSGAD